MSTPESLREICRKLVREYRDRRRSHIVPADPVAETFMMMESTSVGHRDWQEQHGQVPNATDRKFLKVLKIEEW